jgi:DNA-binding CsgD family transcriptional regulator
VEASTITDIWSASQGNVLFVRELVLGALDAGQLVQQHGVWRLTGGLVATQRLHELVVGRLSGLDAASEALDVLAVWEPVGIVALEARTGSEQLELLDRAGLLSIRVDGRRQQVSLAHPLYGEVLRERMPALTRRRLLIELADRLESIGARRREDATRVAAARLQALGSADPELLLKAARLARYALDFPQVERFARAAATDGMTAELGLLLGEALHEAGSYTEADEVLGAAEDLAADPDPLVVYLTEMRTRNLMWGLLDVDAALLVNGQARSRLGDRGAAQIELTLNEALLLAYGGRPRGALDALDAVDTGGELSAPRLRAMRAIAQAPALIGVGRPDTAIEVARRAYAEHSQLPDQIAIPGDGVHILMQMYGLVESGQFQAATALGTAAYDIATSSGAPADGVAWLAHQLGRAALHMGRPQTAHRWLSEARARSEEHRMVSAQRLVLSLLATACAWLGDREGAVTAVDELDRLPRHPFVEPEQQLGRAWTLVAAGDLPSGRQVLHDAAELARRAGYLSTEAQLLHDIVRLGAAASVADRLAALATECEGALVAAYAAHGKASARGRPAALVDVVDQFERMGALLLASEAATEAAQALQDAGDRRASAALGVRAVGLGRHCEGARTPGMTAPVAVTPLTQRERDIATLAADGASSKEIADRLHLSVRTVNNHLQSAYSKLGIAGRRELAAALAERPD